MTDKALTERQTLNKHISGSGFIVGAVALAGFLASIPFANWWLTEHGMWDAPWLGPVPSAVWVVGIAFVLRDVVQLTLGKRWALAGIAAGAGLSYLVASPAIVTASVVAFAVSETLDFLVYTPLAERRFVLAVLLSGLVGGFVDSALFVRIAFDSWDGWWQLGIAKAVVVAAATPVAWGVRRALLRQPLHRAGQVRHV